MQGTMQNDCYAKLKIPGTKQYELNLFKFNAKLQTTEMLLFTIYAAIFIWLLTAEADFYFFNSVKILWLCYWQVQSD